MNNFHVTIIRCLAVVLLLLSAGCSYVAPGSTDSELVSITSIGVLPVYPDSHTPIEESNAAELEDGAEALNSLLTDYFQGYGDVSFISQSELEGLPSGESGRFLYLAREAGQQLNYDAVLVTTVERFLDREGSEYAVITPASVAFSFKLLAVESGRVIWSSDFDQTQQPLLENILKTRSTGSGFRWLTATELASAGLAKKLNSCPYLKKD